MNIPFVPALPPLLTTEQMIEVDRLMEEVYQIDLTRMMENAGRCLAIVAREHFFGGNCLGKNVIVLAGTGGNGGGALVCARRLANWGAQVTVCITHPERMKPIPAQQLAILHQMKVDVLENKELGTNLQADLIIDGIIGYSIAGAARGQAEQMIAFANAHPAPVLALDTPSGLNLTTGQYEGTVIQAEATLTLALPKKGLMVAEVKKWRGVLYLGDISVPPVLYAHPKISLQVGPLFSKSDIVRID